MHALGHDLGYIKNATSNNPLMDNTIYTSTCSGTLHALQSIFSAECTIGMVWGAAARSRLLLILFIEWMANIKEVHGKPRLHVSVSMAAMLRDSVAVSIHHAHAPTSNTASRDNHEKINSWVSFSFLYEYGTPLSFGLLELRYKTLAKSKQKLLGLWKVSHNFQLWTSSSAILRPC